MAHDNVSPKLKKPLTKGWIVTSEPLNPKSTARLSFECYLGVKVKLKGASPHTEYGIGLNVYGRGVPNLGPIRRLAFDPGQHFS